MDREIWRGKDVGYIVKKKMNRSCRKNGMVSVNRWGFRSVNRAVKKGEGKEMDQEIKQRIKKREGCRDSGTLLRRWRSAGDCRLCGRFVLSGGAGDDGAAEDDHFLWRVIYGRECEDFKPGEDGYHGRPERGLSDGSHG